MPPASKNKIRALAKSFLNGEALKDWNLYSVNVVNVKRQDWENFFDWSIEFRVKDFPAEILQNPKIKVTCKNSLDNKFYVEKIFGGESVGEEIKFIIPMNQFQFQLQKPVTMIELNICLLNASEKIQKRKIFLSLYFLQTEKIFFYLLPAGTVLLKNYLLKLF